MGCIPSKNKVLEADSSAPLAIKTQTKKQKKQKRGLESPEIGEDAAPWVHGPGRVLSEKDGMVVITDSRPS
ncbi:hypothetical protein DICSQDRAFT_131076 [Dichomitus squalens LYAD-421 SS1]|uniref:uncharacterized protein n=1 Tax=Dichomitus squalens (strain LYAD-421) TaxID=732165 RepID=UPI0004411CC4|nr:uncharacterized protein DICSQDRAFT_131076 [Dichomitus squalens LYAD-421 SS1]EJF66806.1 hypothetical protein DICSQDRAFT_131076 [Dichomitus squalens LYAD-421 SS1]